MNVVSALRRSFRRSSLRRNKSAENVSSSKEEDGNNHMHWRHGRPNICDSSDAFIKEPLSIRYNVRRHETKRSLARSES